MSIATEILSLRNDRASSVSALMDTIHWAKSAYEWQHRMFRNVQVTSAADIVLLNVAAHAADQLSLFSSAGGERILRTRSERIRRNRRWWPRLNQTVIEAN